MSQLLYFEQQDFAFANAVVVLDVDGTIVPDAGQVAPPEAVAKVNEIKSRGNEICLCSNSRRGNYAERLAMLGAQLQVSICPVLFRKPSLQAIASLERKGRPMVVIGDKDLTDGLLARRAGARFIKVRRKLDPADRLSSRMANVIDIVFGPPAVLIWDALSALSIRL
ncbi:MAG TPA: HAD-IIIA family hydrolase [Xanthobacteraceae bacterium]|jgi:HAD superfamily hydrolase (TIGR01662 family)|nr:HAD-IIIA family hydrolase [Xanthobacteraceae bacterium]